MRSLNQIMVSIFTKPLALGLLWRLWFRWFYEVIKSNHGQNFYTATNL